MKVALFDIDGTIVTKVAKQPTSKQLAYTRALEDVYGLCDLNYMDYPIFGLTDIGILYMILRENGLSHSEIQDQELEFAGRMQEIHHEMAAGREQQYGALPGARELLTELKFRGVKLGLATGNYEAIGWFKLRESGLEDFFTFGGFGEDGADRADIVARAIIKSGETDKSQISLIGDTPHDLDGARRNGVHPRAVATGRFSMDELKKYADAPEHVIPDMKDLEVAISCLVTI